MEKEPRTTIAIAAALAAFVLLVASLLPEFYD